MFIESSAEIRLSVTLEQIVGCFISLNRIGRFGRGSRGRFEFYGRENSIIGRCYGGKFRNFNNSATFVVSLRYGELK